MAFTREQRDCKFPLLVRSIGRYRASRPPTTATRASRMSHQAIRMVYLIAPLMWDTPPKNISCSRSSPSERPDSSTTGSTDICE